MGSIIVTPKKSAVLTFHTFRAVELNVMLFCVDTQRTCLVILSHNFYFGFFYNFFTIL